MEKWHHHEPHHNQRRRHSHVARESEVFSHINHHQILSCNSVTKSIPRDKQSIIADTTMQAQRHNCSSIRPGRTDNGDYIQKWLAEADGAITVPYEVGKETSEHHIGHERARDDMEHHLDQKRLRRKHDSSSDSSFLPAPLQRRPHISGPERINKTGMEEQEGPMAHLHKMPRVASTTSNARSAIRDSKPKEAFEKRARHKTREDRYDLKAQNRKHDENTRQKRTTTKRQKKSGRKATKRASEDLMNDFTSQSIGGDRLTLRPSYGVGLFNKGRASYPAKRKGLSDLAFSEMEFLQHSNRRSPSIGTKHRKVETQENHGRRPQKEQDISRFFAKTRMPLCEINCNAGTQQSPTHNAPRECESQDQYNRSLGDHRGNNVHLDRDSTSVQERALLVGRQLGSSSKLSGKATTYDSLSESRYSPMAATPLPRSPHNNHGHGSLTPESVRNLLGSTEIFRNTGLERRGNCCAANDRDTSNQQERQQPGPDDTYQCNSQDERDFTTISINRQKGSPHNQICYTGNTPLPENSTGADHHVESAQEETSGKEPNRRDDIDAIEAGMRAISNHADSRVRQHEGSSPHLEDSHSHGAVPKCVMPENSPSTTMTREQLAKQARIKRPFPALPTTGSTGVGLDMTDSDMKLTETKEYGQVPATISMDRQVDMRDIAQEPELEILPKPTVPNTETFHNSFGDVKHASYLILSSAERPESYGRNLKDPSAREKSHSQSGVAIPSWTNYLNNSGVQAPNVDHALPNVKLQRENNPPPPGLPLRGGWRYNLDATAQLSPLGLGEPVFVRQAGHDHDDAPEDFTWAERFQRLDKPAPFRSITPSLVDNPTPDGMVYDENGMAFQDDVYDYQMLDTDDGAIWSTYTYTDMANLSETAHQDCGGHQDEVVDSDAYDGRYEHYLRTHASNDRAAIPIEAPEAHYHVDEGSFSMQRFWTPYRQY